MPDVITTGPGLRAYSIARPLAAAGHEVSLIFDSSEDDPRQQIGDMGAALRIEIRRFPLRRLGELLEHKQYNYAIFTNFIQFKHVIIDIEAKKFAATAFLYDLFAPKILENRSTPGVGMAQIDREIMLKRRSLRVSSAILVNGKKKIPYAAAWLLASGADPDKPLIPVPFAIAPQGVRPTRTGDTSYTHRRARKVAIAGHQQSWTTYQMSFVRILQALTDNRWALFSCGQPDLSGIFANPHWADRFASLEIESYPTLPFDSFCVHQASCDLLLDVFARTRERELAYVTRTAVALSNGLPAIHPAWTETGAIIREFRAGWLYESEKEIPAIIEWISNNPADLRDKTARAMELQEKLMNENCATLALQEYIERKPPRPAGARIRRVENAAGSPDTSRFLHRIFDGEWYAIHFGLPLMHEDEAPADYYERHASPETSSPNFLLAHVKVRAGLGDLRLMTVEQILFALAGWLDFSWIARRLSLPVDTSSPSDLVIEYFRRSRTRRLDPNPLFSERFYTNFQPDVADALRLGAFVNGYDHYLSVGQDKAYVPSPWFCTLPQALQPPDGKSFQPGFEKTVRDLDRLDESPTPFFDLEFWRKTSPAGAAGVGLGREFKSFIERFQTEDVFGSEFHRDAVTSRLVSDGIDRMLEVRDTVLEQALKVAPGNVADLRGRLDAQMERNIQGLTEKLSRFSWALGVLSAYRHP